MNVTLVSPPYTLIQTTLSTATGLAFALILLHIIYKRCIVADWMCWDDGLLWCGSLFAFALNVLTMYQASLGRPSSQGSNVETILKLQYVDKLLHIFAMTTLKASILLFFYRVLRSNKAVRWTVYFSLILLSLWAITFVSINLFQCRPVAFFWNRGAPKGQCITDDSNISSALAIIDTSLNALTDFLCLLAAWPALEQDKMSTTKKAGIALAYILGGCKVVMTLTRLLYQVTTPPNPLGVPAILMALEANITVVIASLPGLSSLLHRISPSTARVPRSLGGGSSTTTLEELNPKSHHQSAYSESQLYLHNFKRTPLDDYPIMTQVISNDPLVCGRSPSLDFGAEFGGAGGILVTSEVERKVDRVGVPTWRVPV